MALLNEQEINSKLEELNGWSYENNSIHKEYKKSNFTNALGFVTMIGVEAEKMDHHPDILMYGWNKVKITISTHSEGGVTEKDIKLAQTIEKLY